MITHMPGFHSFFSFFASFCIGQISHQQHKSDLQQTPLLAHAQTELSSHKPTAHVRDSHLKEYLLGLGSIAGTSSARESLMVDTHHLLTSSDELITPPPPPPPPPPQLHKSLPCAFTSSKKHAAKVLRQLPLKLHCERHYRAR